MKEEQDHMNALLRNNFNCFLHRCMLTLNPGAPFMENWHIEAIAYQLQRVREGEATRLIINLPPRYLKSLTVSVIFPAFLLGHNPRLKIFGISYGTELSAKHAADFRAIVESDWYRRAFPNMRIWRAAESDVFTTKRGFRRSTSVSAALTGLGGDILIIDDPQKPDAPQSETLRNDVGFHLIAAQYQQATVPPGGAMIRRPWLRYYDKLPEITYRKVIQSWDTAAKNGAQNDWSVCTTWLIHEKQFYLLDVTRGRYEYPQLRATAIALAERYKPDTVLIEEASTGIALAQELRQGGTFAVRPIPVERDKIGRLYVQQAKFEAGLVLFPRAAPFLAALEAELLTFPQGRTDDQVDSISQALAYKTCGYDTSMRWVES